MAAEKEGREGEGAWLMEMAWRRGVGAGGDRVRDVPKQSSLVRVSGAAILAH